MQVLYCKFFVSEQEFMLHTSSCVDSPPLLWYNRQKYALRGYHMSKEKIVEKVYSQSMGAVEIWVDRETGVNYLYRQSGYSGGLTVLLGKDGNPVITPILK